MSLEDAFTIVLLLVLLMGAAIMTITVVEHFRQLEHRRRMERAAAERRELVLRKRLDL